MTKKILALSALTGAVLVFAFPPIGLGFVAYFAFVPLMFALHGQTRLRGLALGFIAGFVFFAGTVYWVVHSMYYYGGVPVFISIPVMFALAAYLAVYFALFGLFFPVFSARAPVFRVAAVSALWVSIEYLRGNLFTGFPWALLGYSQTPYLPVIQIADITGVSGLSFIVMAINAAFFFSIKSFVDKEKTRPVIELVTIAALFAATLIYGFVRIEQVDSEAAKRGGFKAAIAQGSIDQSVKWDRSLRSKTIEIYKSLSIEAAKKGASFMLWPETAAPFFLGVNKDETDAVTDAAVQSKAYILTGAPAFSYNGDVGGYKYFNSAYLIDGKGAITGRYDKFHLVPYGEYVPLKRFFPFIKKLTVGVGAFAEGRGPYPIGFTGGDIGVLICYEAIFPEIARETVKNGAAFLVNITNDAWFGTTSAPYQHFEMSRMRAVENRVYMMRAANTGISAFIAPSGRVIAMTGLFERTFIAEKVGIKNAARMGFYTRFGDVFAYGCLLFIAVFLLTRLRRGGLIKNV
ncbi:MAG: apolipoprotein N-acyltransferase [Deltaproteobacteria bacterium]|nr:apolipoprotein N-acyltransferase [Deltaproteobacteria bacterium]